VIPGLAARTALGRLGEPDDIGTVVAALLGDESRWITAQDIEVSGGYHLWREWHRSRSPARPAVDAR
jgi:NAD(P)-dependent dehydrogenase (short-subunit alcohol dehydrogenase family)